MYQSISNWPVVGRKIKKRVLHNILFFFFGIRSKAKLKSDTVP